MKFFELPKFQISY